VAHFIILTSVRCVFLRVLSRPSKLYTTSVSFLQETMCAAGGKKIKRNCVFLLYLYIYIETTLFWLILYKSKRILFSYLWKHSTRFKTRLLTVTTKVVKKLYLKKNLKYKRIYFSEARTFFLRFLIATEMFRRKYSKINFSRYIYIYLLDLTRKPKVIILIVIAPKNKSKNK
jgi:hypothetical protein